MKTLIPIHWLTVSVGMSLALTNPQPSQAISFNLNPTFDTTTTQGQQALNGFQSAANLWSNEFNDNVTINLDIGFQSLDPNVLGQTSTTRQVVSVGNFANQLANDITSSNDKITVSNLHIIN